MENKVKVGKHYGHITFPYTEDIGNIFLKKYEVRIFSIYSPENVLLSTGRYTRKFIDSMKEVGYKFKETNVSRIRENLDVMGEKVFRVSISKKSGKIKEVVVTLESDSVMDLSKRMTYLKEKVKKDTGIESVTGDIWSKTELC